MGRNKGKAHTGVRILNELGRNAIPFTNDPLHPNGSGLYPFVQVVISF